MHRLLILTAAGAAFLAMGTGGVVSARNAAEKPFYRSEFIFPLDALHNHSSCVVECPNGDLLVCWYRGSGERKADDVAVLGARKKAGSGKWSEPFVMADIPGFPDCNPSIFIDPQKRLWLFWVTIQANEWHTALLRYKIAEKYQQNGAPVWSQEKVLHLKPGEEFTRAVQASVDADLKRLDQWPADRREAVRAYLEARRKNAADRYFNRLGWMPRAHPYVLEDKRLILPLYSDGFDFSLMALTDDWGDNWRVSSPLVGAGPVQPSIARKRNGTLSAYMRDNGPPPQRVLYSESEDAGETWSPVRDSELPDPGAGVEVLNLRSGLWAFINNDTEEGRHSLAVSLSDDEGKSWKWTRHLERDPAGEGSGSYHYPSILQGRDGTLHVTYSYFAPQREVKRDGGGRELRKSIKHAQFNEAWIKAGDG